MNLRLIILFLTLVSAIKGGADYDYSSSIESEDDTHSSEESIESELVSHNTTNLNDDADSQESEVNNSVTYSDICSVCDCSNTSQTAVHLFIDCHSKSIDLNHQWLHDMNRSNAESIDLDLADNGVLQLTPFPELPIWSLDLSRNEISYIENGTFDKIADFLMVLDLSHNHITTNGLINGCFGGMKDDGTELKLQIIELSLAHNQLHSLPPDIFRSVTSITDLDLSDNAFGEITMETVEALRSLPNLSILYLRNNGISSLPAELFDSNKGLISLDLAGNQLIELEAPVHNLVNLESLVLDNNKFNTLVAHTFFGLENIRNLSISNTLGLRYIEEDTFTHLTNLTHLRISENKQLRWISPDAWRSDQSAMFNLKVLDLSKNDLHYLPPSLLPHSDAWNHIDYLDLQGNPWTCDCHNEWLIYNLVPSIKNNTPEYTQDLTCKGPSHSILHDEAIFVIHQLLGPQDLPCPTGKFDMSKKDFGHDTLGYQELKANSTFNYNPTVMGTGVLCFLAVAVTSGIVGVLYVRKSRRQQKSRLGRGGDSTNLSRGRYVEATIRSSGGVINTEFVDDEDETVIGDFSQRQMETSIVEVPVERTAGCEPQFQPPDILASNSFRGPTNAQ